VETGTGVPKQSWSSPGTVTALTNLVSPLFSGSPVR